jgi:hypothetical protein
VNFTRAACGPVHNNADNSLDDLVVNNLLFHGLRSERD